MRSTAIFLPTLLDVGSHKEPNIGTKACSLHILFQTQCSLQHLKETELGFEKNCAKALGLLNSHLYLNSQFSWPVRERWMPISLTSERKCTRLLAASPLISYFIAIPSSLVNLGLRSHDGAQPQWKYEQATAEALKYFSSYSMLYMGAQLPLY